jgi:hypothetical protein
MAQQGGSQAAGMVAGRVAQAVGNIIGNVAGGPRGPGGPGGGSPGGSGGPGGSSGPGGGSGGGQGKSDGPTSMIESDEPGMAAGSVPAKWGVWGSGSNTWVGGDQLNNDYFGRIQNGLIGGDVTIDGVYIVGLSVGAEKDWTRIKYSGVGIEGDGAMISPYAAYIIDQYFYVDASAGMTWMRYHESSDSQSGDYNGKRWFAGANLNASRTFDAWSASTNIGYLYTAERQDAYLTTSNYAQPESKSRTGQIRSTTKLGRTHLTDWGWFYPYASARLEYDANKTGALYVDTQGTKAANSRFGTTFGVGSSVGLGSNSSLTLEGTSTEFREHSSIYGISGTVRVTF